eukprot:365573-Chlamydomonas_euryale.AAC.21
MGVHGARELCQVGLGGARGRMGVHGAQVFQTRLGGVRGRMGVHGARVCHCSFTTQHGCPHPMPSMDSIPGGGSERAQRASLPLMVCRRMPGAGGVHEQPAPMPSMICYGMPGFGGAHALGARS